ncbi:galactokinase [Cellulomonas denverensis]|uniref:Galactokinase n=1 Tax=Cellulomonas denverensis TaxID=264297 RepID=A0A7X6R0T7_9CELL|nr:galactokinase [Cellulomonas denverensis]NKY24550.1 galactokinase [Cellulomonas denverensis]GIG26298.1 galactokinase [Cellulomonas denverensis]
MTTTTWVAAWDRADGAERARALFAEQFGAEPAGVWSAPGRVNLIGEHTDYNGGLALPFALPHRTYVAVRPATGDRIRLVSAQEAGVREVDLAAVAPGTVDGWPSYVAGVAWALRQAGHPVGGFDIAVDSCVPYGSGLSSSAALECAVAVALDALNGIGLAGTDAGRTTLTALCVRAENEIAGANTGGMDQAVSLRGRAGHALELDCRDDSVRQVPFDLTGHDLALLVIDTKAEHSHAGGEYAARRADCERAAELLEVGTLREIGPDDLGDALATLARVTGPEGADSALAEVLVRRVRHVVTEIGRVQEFVALLEAGRLTEVGAAMDASHASLRDDYQVSCRELDLAVETARDAGALGARMTGGGFGGSAIALVPAAAVQPVATAVAEAFEAAGLRAPAFLVATAEGPAA